MKIWLKFFNEINALQIFRENRYRFQEKPRSKRSPAEAGQGPEVFMDSSSVVVARGLVRYGIAVRLAFCELFVDLCRPDIVSLSSDFLQRFLSSSYGLSCDEINRRIVVLVKLDVDGLALCIVCDDDTQARIEARADNSSFVAVSIDIADYIHLL
nr:MAG TPA: hypothetical protein [Caudoviricetes sp.]